MSSDERSSLSDVQSFRPQPVSARDLFGCCNVASSPWDTMMQLYVIRRSGAFANMQELKDLAPESKRIGDEDMADRIRWIRSYVVEEPDHRLGTVCVYEAKDEETIREHARRAGIPGDDTFLVVDSVIARPDPK